MVERRSECRIYTIKDSENPLTKSIYTRKQATIWKVRIAFCEISFICLGSKNIP